MNRLITRSKIKSIIKKFLANKSPGLDGFTREFYQNINKNLHRNISNSSKTLKGRKHSQSNSMKPPPPKTLPKNYTPIFLMDTNAKILNKILEN